MRKERISKAPPPPPTPPRHCRREGAARRSVENSAPSLINYANGRRAPCLNFSFETPAVARAAALIIHRIITIITITVSPSGCSGRQPPTQGINLRGCSCTPVLVHLALPNGDLHISRHLIGLRRQARFDF